VPKKNSLLATLTFEGEPLSPVNAYASRIIKLGNQSRSALYLPAKYQEYKKRIKAVALDVASRHKIEPYPHPVQVVVRVYFGTRRVKDLSNAGKLEYDALNGVVWNDDSQIFKETKEKYYDKEAPRIEIDVYEYPQAKW